MSASPEQWAERRDGLVTALGNQADRVDRTLFKARIQTHRWKSVRRGVAAINGTPPTWRQSVRAAVLAAGPDAFASHLTALVLYEVEIRNLIAEAIHLSAPNRCQHRMKGVVSHRFHNIEHGDISDRWGIATASPLRIVIDLSGQATDAQLGRIVDEFLRRKQLDLADPL